MIYLSKQIDTILHDTNLYMTMIVIQEAPGNKERSQNQNKATLI